MKTIQQIKAEFPNPQTAKHFYRDDNPPEWKEEEIHMSISTHYCVGGTICLGTGKKERFPDPSNLIEVLRKRNPHSYY